MFQFESNACSDRIVDRVILNASCENFKRFVYKLKINKMRLGLLIPNFSAQTTNGPIQFYDWQGDSYVWNFYFI